MSQIIKLKCPYCSHIFNVAPPEDDVGTPIEIECLPYTRDIGKFDEKGWGKIGKDFFSAVLGWERIGVLRLVEGMNVWYMAPRCPKCHEFMDVFSNYSEGLKFSELFPHLLGVKKKFSSTEDNIACYTGQSLSGRVHSRLSRLLLGNELAAALSIGMILYLVSLIPLWIQVSSVNSIIKDYWEELILRGAGSISLVLLLVQFSRYLNFLENEDGFYQLFKVQSRRSVTFWKNFSRSRFVGVQTENRRSSVRQATIAVGLPVLTLMFVTWALHIVGGKGLLPMLLVSGVSFIFGSAIDFSLRKKECYHGSKILFWKRLKQLFLPIRWGGIIGLVLSLVAWLAFLILSFGPIQMLYQVFALGFWGIIGYYIGVGCWFSFNTSTYILKGLKKIPMNLSALDGFQNIKPLEEIANISSTSNLIIFVFGVAVAAMGAVKSQIPPGSIYFSVEWLLNWGTGSLIFLFIVLSISVGYTIDSSSFLPAGILYLLISQIPFPDSQISISNTSLTVSYKVMSFGIFLSYLLYFQYRTCCSPIEYIKRKYKKEELNKYNAEITKVQKELEKLPQSQKIGPFSLNVPFMIWRSILYEHLRDLFAIRDRILTTTVPIQTRYTMVAKILSPLISSWIIPILLKHIQNYLGL